MPDGHEASLRRPCQPHTHTCLGLRYSTTGHVTRTPVVMATDVTSSSRARRRRCSVEPAPRVAAIVTAAILLPVLLPGRDVISVSGLAVAWSGCPPAVGGDVASNSSGAAAATCECSDFDEIRCRNLPAVPPFAPLLLFTVLYVVSVLMNEIFKFK